MPAIVIDQFSGTLPAVAPKLLPPDKAVKSHNARVNNGQLRTLRSWGSAQDTPANPYIYRYRGQGADAWISFAADVDVVPSPIPDDAWRRIYYTGEAEPRYQDSTNYGSGYRRLGVPAPAAAPACIRVAGTAPDNGIEDDATRFYLTTWVTDRGEESAPSPASAAVELQLTDDSVDLTVPALMQNDHNISKLRIYRSATTADVADFLLVAELDQSTGTETVYSDSKTDAELSIALPSSTWDMPPQDMRGLTLMPGGFMVGFDKQTLYASEPYLPFAWPANNNLALEYDVVGLATISAGAVVCTRGTPYLLTGYTPDGLSLIDLDLDQACVSQRSIVDMGNVVIYASPDGLVAISANRAELITAGVIERRDWQAVWTDLSLIRAARYEGAWVGTDGTNTLIFDVTSGTLHTSSFAPQSWFFDREADLLYGYIGGEIRALDQGEIGDTEWESKVFTTPPTSYGYAMVELEPEPGESLTVDVLADEQVIQSVTVNQARKVMRLKPVRASSWQVKLSGKAQAVSKVVLAHDPREL